MKILAMVVLVALTLLYVALAGVGLVMSAFCFDSGAGQAAWQCFAGINAAFTVPALVCVIGGIILAIRRRYKTAMVVAAVPALLAVLLWLIVFAANAAYSWRVHVLAPGGALVLS